MIRRDPRLFLLCPALLAAALAAPAWADGNPFCVLTLAACDYEREDSGACPTGTAATATLFAEGDHWYLDTTGITADPADGPSTAAETLRVVNAGDTGDGTRVFFIAGRPGLDGVLMLGATGAAHLQVLGDAGANRTLFETYFNGTCEAIDP